MNDVEPEVVPVELLDGRKMGQPGHVVQFYEDERCLLDALRVFIREGFLRGDRCLVVATEAHCKALDERLQADGLDMHAVRARGDYLSLDASETLSTFMVNELPDETQFTESVGRLVAKLADGRRLRVFGEMVAVLCAEGNAAAAAALEERWNDLGRRSPFSLFCAYPLNGFHSSLHQESFAGICKQHDRVIPAESYARLSNAEERLRIIAELQQKAISLEAEIAERKKGEQTLRRREQELADVLENCVQGIHRVGPDGRILWANRAELTLLGYGPEEYIGHHIAEFHVDPEVIAEILAKLLGGESLYNYPARLRCKDGEIKDVLIHSNALFEHGQFVHTRCFTRDITDLKRAERQIQHLNDTLNEKIGELREKIMDLELFHDVAVDRELKMMELEKENHALKRERSRVQRNDSKPLSDSLPPR